jgi:hypothetical protein
MVFVAIMARSKFLPLLPSSTHGKSLQSSLISVSRGLNDLKQKISLSYRGFGDLSRAIKNTQSDLGQQEMELLFG